MIRSKPPYANRLLAPNFPLRMLVRFPIPELQHRGDQQLSNPKWKPHGPGRKPAVIGSDGQTNQPGGEIPHADEKHLARQEPARGEYAKTEYHLPQTRQHPDAVRREA